MPDITDEQMHAQVEVLRTLAQEGVNNYPGTLAAQRGERTLALLDDYARLRRFEAEVRELVDLLGVELTGMDVLEPINALDAARKGGA